MTTDEIKARLHKLENVDGQEVGCRVAELRCILGQLQNARFELNQANQRAERNWRLYLEARAKQSCDL